MPSPYDADYFATTEDAAAEASGDFPLLVPEAQVIAQGSDGVIAADDPWVLSSSVPFEAQGVVSGDVVVLSGDIATAAFREFGSGEIYAVDSVAGSDLTLRIIGEESGIGEPPGVAADLSSVRFVVPTLRRQLRSASSRIRRELNFDEAGDLIAEDDLRDLAVYDVLARLYLAASVAAGDSRDDLANKAKMYARLRDRLAKDLSGRRRSGYLLDEVSIIPVD